MIAFPTGSTETVIEVPITNDQLMELTERFFGRVISGVGILGLDIFAPIATVDISNNDSISSYSCPAQISSLSVELSSHCTLYTRFLSLLSLSHVHHCKSLYQSTGLIFGFEQPVYNFSESVGTSNLVIRLSPESAQLTQNLIFILSTADSTAVGEPSIVILYQNNS